MKNSNINLRDLVILVADPNSYLRKVVNGMLRGFGANKVLEVDRQQCAVSFVIRSENRSAALRYAVAAVRRPQTDPHDTPQRRQREPHHADLADVERHPRDDGEECPRCRREYRRRQADVPEQHFTTVLAGSLSIRVRSSIPKLISGRTAASRSRAIRMASAAAEATRSSTSPPRKGPRLARTTSTASLAMPASDNPDVKAPFARGAVFSADTRFERMRAGPAGWIANLRYREPRPKSKR